MIESGDGFHAFVANPLIPFSSCQICMAPENAPVHAQPEGMSGEMTHPIEALRQMVADDIKRTGATESFMIRSGLLADLLDELASLRIFHCTDSLPAEPVQVADKILWHVEQVCGPLSTETVENPGDDDRSILLHNIRAALATPIRTPPMNDLIERIEAATPESAEREELGVAINEALDIASYITDDGDPTQSIDAALTLVPEGWRFGIEQAGSYDGSTRDQAWCWPYESNFDPDWQSGQQGYRDAPDGTQGSAATPALALCAAALKARAYLKETNNGQ